VRRFGDAEDAIERAEQAALSAATVLRPAGSAGGQNAGDIDLRATAVLDAYWNLARDVPEET